MDVPGGRSYKEGSYTEAGNPFTYMSNGNNSTSILNGIHIS